MITKRSFLDVAALLDPPLKTMTVLCPLDPFCNDFSQSHLFV